MIEFICASHNESVLQQNLLGSEILRGYKLTVQRGFTNVSKAYNGVKTTQPFACYIHHDVWLPPSFRTDLANGIRNAPEDWEVLGVAGVKLVDGKRENHGNILDRGKEWGRSIAEPVKVDTLDELLLITRGNIKFDEQFEQDFYGADICVGRNCYVIPAFVYHNSGRSIGGRTESFYKSEELFRIKHKDKLPIQTTCSLIS